MIHPNKVSKKSKKPNIVLIGDKIVEITKDAFVEVGPGDVILVTSPAMLSRAKKSRKG